MKTTLREIFKEDRKCKTVMDVAAILAFIGIVLFLAAITSCGSVKKLVHKEQHKSDSLSVTSYDSTRVLSAEINETKFSIDSLQFEVFYDTTGVDTAISSVISPYEYFTYEGKVLSDVFKAARQAGKPNRIVISTGKINKETKEHKASDSITTHKNTEAHVVTSETIINKDIKRTSYWWLLWIFPILLIIVAYRNRKRIIQFFNPVKL